MNTGNARRRGAVRCWHFSRILVEFICFSRWLQIRVGAKPTWAREPQRRSLGRAEGGRAAAGFAPRFREDPGPAEAAGLQPRYHRLGPSKCGDRSDGAATQGGRCFCKELAPRDVLTYSGRSLHQIVPWPGEPRAPAAKGGSPHQRRGQGAAGPARERRGHAPN